MHRYTTFHRSDSFDSSTTATASNLPGAGRSIGILYSRGGRLLERAIGRAAHKLGFGPSAVALRVKKIIMSRGLDSYTEQDEKPDFQQSQERAVLKLCRKLVKYMRSEQATTQVAAQRSIVGLLEAYPPLRRIFMKYWDNILTEIVHIDLVVEIASSLKQPRFQGFTLDMFVLHRVGQSLLALDAHSCLIGYGRENKLMIYLLDYLLEGEDRASAALQYLEERFAKHRKLLADDDDGFLDFSICRKFAWIFTEFMNHHLPQSWKIGDTRERDMLLNVVSEFIHFGFKWESLYEYVHGIDFVMCILIIDRNQMHVHCVPGQDPRQAIVKNDRDDHVVGALQPPGLTATQHTLVSTSQQKQDTDRVEPQQGEKGILASESVNEQVGTALTYRFVQINKFKLGTMTLRGQMSFLATNIQQICSEQPGQKCAYNGLSICNVVATHGRGEMRQTLHVRTRPCMCAWHVVRGIHVTRHATHCLSGRLHLVPSQDTIMYCFPGHHYYMDKAVTQFKVHNHTLVQGHLPVFEPTQVSTYGTTELATRTVQLALQWLLYAPATIPEQSGGNKAIGQEIAICHFLVGTYLLRRFVGVHAPTHNKGGHSWEHRTRRAPCRALVSLVIFVLFIISSDARLTAETMVRVY